MIEGEADAEGEGEGEAVAMVEGEGEGEGEAEGEGEGEGETLPSALAGVGAEAEAEGEGEGEGVPLTLGVWMPAEWERWFSFSIIAIFSIPTAQFLSRRTVWRDLTPDEFHARLLKHRHWFIFCVFSARPRDPGPGVQIRIWSR